MVQTYNNDTNVSGYYNKKYISREKNNLVSGQTVSQSDFLNSDSRHNAVKLFDKNINTSWKSQIKGGTYLDDINRRQKFKRNLYSKISTYHSTYSTPEIGKTNDSTYSLTKLNNDKGIHGSWTQVTYSRPLIAGSMYIQMEDRGDSYIEQMQTVQPWVSMTTRRKQTALLFEYALTGSEKARIELLEMIKRTAQSQTKAVISETS